MDRTLHAGRDAQNGALLKLATVSPFDRQAAVESWKRLLIGGALAGAGTRSALGLINLLRRNLDRRTEPEEEVRVPLPAPLRSKQAETAPMPPVGDPWNYPTHWVMAPLAAGGGAVAAYKLVDWLLDSARKYQLKSDTEAARQAFLRTIAESGTDAQAGEKTASAYPSPAAEALDRLFELYTQKQAGLREWANKAQGAYALYALATSLLTGTLAYGAARKRNREKILQEAERRMADVRRYETPPRLTLDVPRDEEETQA